MVRQVILPLRIFSIDEAKDILHVPQYYKDLDQEAKLKYWRQEFPIRLDKANETLWTTFSQAQLEKAEKVTEQMELLAERTANSEIHRSFLFVRDTFRAFPIAFKNYEEMVALSTIVFLELDTLLAELNSAIIKMEEDFNAKERELNSIKKKYSDMLRVMEGPPEQEEPVEESTDESDESEEQETSIPRERVEESARYVDTSSIDVKEPKQTSSIDDNDKPRMQVTLAPEVPSDALAKLREDMQAIGQMVGEITLEKRIRKENIPMDGPPIVPNKIENALPSIPITDHSSSEPIMPASQSPSKSVQDSPIVTKSDDISDRFKFYTPEEIVEIPGYGKFIRAPRTDRVYPLLALPNIYGLSPKTIAYDIIKKYGPIDKRDIYFLAKPYGFGQAGITHTVNRQTEKGVFKYDPITDTYTIGDDRFGKYGKSIKLETEKPAEENDFSIGTGDNASTLPSGDDVDKPQHSYE